MDPDDRYHNDKCERAVIDTHTLWRASDDAAPSAVKAWGADICSVCGAAEGELFQSSCEEFRLQNEVTATQVSVKVVPNEDPNAEGEFRSIEVPSAVLHQPQPYIWDLLVKHLPPELRIDHHVVAYVIEKQQSKEDN